MDYRPGKKRTMTVAIVDRLSSLPDDLIHKILSFVDIKDAINTSTCSSRWRFIWTLMPYLNFSSQHFSDSNKFYEFVTHVLSQRNHQIEVFSLKLTLSFSDLVSKLFLTNILDYAFSHNAQELTLSCVFVGKVKFPLGLFRSQSLKYLRLTAPTCEYSSIVLPRYSNIVESTWELPALTTLHLDMIKFCDDDSTRLFSKCPNLKNLTLNHFRKKRSDISYLSISHHQISSLTLENGHFSLAPIYVDVVAPQLKHLRIIKCLGRHRISAPNLVSLFFRNYQLLQFSNDDLNSLEKVYFCLSHLESHCAHKFVDLLQRFYNVKFLSLNSELVESLSSYLKLISLKASPFANLKSLKIYPEEVSEKAEEGESPLTIASELKNYLLDSSPSATFTIVSREEVRGYRNAVAVQNLMAKLWDMLEKEKAISETNMTRMDQKKETMESHKEEYHGQGNAQVDDQRAPVEKLQIHIRGKMAKIKSCWEDLGVQIDQGREKACHIISKLRDIEVLILSELPASKRDKLQACFSNLCAEVDIAVKKIIDGMKSQCDEKQIHLSDCFYEPETTSLPFS